MSGYKGDYSVGCEVFARQDIELPDGRKVFRGERGRVVDTAMQGVWAGWPLMLVKFGESGVSLVVSNREQDWYVKAAGRYPVDPVTGYNLWSLQGKAEVNLKPACNEDLEADARREDASVVTKFHYQVGSKVVMRRAVNPTPSTSKDCIPENTPGQVIGLLEVPGDVGVMRVRFSNGREACFHCCQNDNYVRPASIRPFPGLVLAHKGSGSPETILETTHFVSGLTLGGNMPKGETRVKLRGDGNWLTQEQLDEAFVTSMGSCYDLGAYQKLWPSPSQGQGYATVILDGAICMVKVGEVLTVTTPPSPRIQTAPDLVRIDFRTSKDGAYHLELTRLLGEVLEAGEEFGYIARKVTESSNKLWWMVDRKKLEANRKCVDLLFKLKEVSVTIHDKAAEATKAPTASVSTSQTGSGTVPF